MSKKTQRPTSGFTYSMIKNVHFFEILCKFHDANFCVLTNGVWRLVTAKTRANNFPLTLLITSILAFPSATFRS